MFRRTTQQFHAFLRLFLFIGALTHFFATNSFALVPLVDPDHLSRPDRNTPQDQFIRVRTARVVVADYALIEKDFPEVKGFDHHAIDAWLLSYAGFIAISQATQTEVNTQILTEGDPLMAFRPGLYGRGAVFPTQQGLIDAKGTGAEEPKQRHHGNGLATTGEALREYIMEKAVSAILEDVRIDTVKCYGVLDYGFDVIHADGTRSEAGSVLRQAHARGKPITNGQTEKAMSIEKMLRSFGLTSCEVGRGYDAPNLQATDEDALVDFGSYVVHRIFERPVLNESSVALILDSDEELLSRIAMDPKEPDFVQPDPRFRLPYEIWGSTKSGIEDPAFDNLSSEAHEFARTFRAEKKSADELVNKFLAPVRAILQKKRRRNTQLCSAAMS